MRDKAIPDYTSFFSDKAVYFARWSVREKNRVKARKIYEVACRVEYRYRKDKTGNTSPDVHSWSGERHTFADTFLMIGYSELRRIKDGMS